MPFELGRPFGAPNEPEFQLDVLRSALALLEERSGPLLRDYPREAPSTATTADEGWACPLPAPALEPATTPRARLQQQFAAEIRFLRPWYDESFATLGRTAVGLSGLTVDEADAMASALIDVSTGEEVEAPEGARHELPELVRYLSDDLKAFYLEAAAAQPRSRRPSAHELNSWLFGETVFGSVLYDARDALQKSGDRSDWLLGFFLVPQVYRERPVPVH